MHRSDLLGASVHDLRKRFDTSGIIPGQTSRDVIRAFHQQGAQKIDSLISVARLDIQLHRVSHCIRWLHVTWRSKPLSATMRGSNFLRRRGPELIRIFTIFAGIRVRYITEAAVVFGIPSGVYSVGAGIVSGVSFDFARARCERV
jgi:hypothetical protein